MDEREAWRARRRPELARMPKSRLVTIHQSHGGLLRRDEYMQWDKEDLIEEILYDEWVTRSRPGIAPGGPGMPGSSG